MTISSIMNNASAIIDVEHDPLTCKIEAGSNEGCFIQVLGIRYRFNHLEADSEEAQATYLALIQFSLNNRDN